MEPEQRRQAIYELLQNSGQPWTGTALAKQFQVSRQIIVGDVAILRATGLQIFATPQGYVLPFPGERRFQVTLACQHDGEQLEEELRIMVEEGAHVEDIAIDHPIYGELRAKLLLKSQEDVTSFLQKLSETDSQPLSVVTRGIHLHTLALVREEQAQNIRRRLREKGMLAE